MPTATGPSGIIRPVPWRAVFFYIGLSSHISPVQSIKIDRHSVLQVSSQTVSIAGKITSVPTSRDRFDGCGQDPVVPLRTARVTPDVQALFDFLGDLPTGSLDPIHNIHHHTQARAGPRFHH